MGEQGSRKGDSGEHGGNWSLGPVPDAEASDTLGPVTSPKRQQMRASVRRQERILTIVAASEVETPHRA